MYTDTLILVSLCSDHNVSLVQNEYRYFPQVKKFKLNRPVEDFARRSDDYVIIDFWSSLYWNDKY